MTGISERKCARFYIYKKQKELQNVFICKNPDTFQKAKQFPLHFYQGWQGSVFYLLSFIRFKLFKTIESDPAYLS